MAITVATARTLLTNHKEDLSDVSSNLFLDWVQFVDRFVYRSLVDLDPEQFISTSTINVVSGTATYATPSDFGHMRSDGTGIFEVDSEGKDTANLLSRTGFGRRQRGYWLDGSSPANITLTPEPVDTETLKLRYIPTYTAPTGDSSNLNIPDEYQEFLLDALDKSYTRWDEDQSNEFLADQRFTRDLNELLDSYRREPDVLEFQDTRNAY